MGLVLNQNIETPDEIQACSVERNSVIFPREHSLIKLSNTPPYYLHSGVVSIFVLHD